MKPEKRNLEVYGITKHDIAKQVLTGLAKGLVLYNRKVKGIGKNSRTVYSNWILVRPVIDDGIVKSLIEDEETREFNKVGKFKYGIRSEDIATKSLRAITPGVFWLSGIGAEMLKDYDIHKPFDLWPLISPASYNYKPAYGDEAGYFTGVGNDPEKAIEKLSKGDGRDAIAALLEGLHLVDTTEVIEVNEKPTYRNLWRPMIPIYGVNGKIEGYGENARVLRYTVNGNRQGFVNSTFSLLAPLIEESGYDPVSFLQGHSYKLKEEWRAKILEVTGIVSEVSEGFERFEIKSPDNEVEGRASRTFHSSLILSDPEGNRDFNQLREDTRQIEIERATIEMEPLRTVVLDASHEDYQPEANPFEYNDASDDLEIVQIEPLEDEGSENLLSQSEKADVENKTSGDCERVIDLDSQEVRDENVSEISLDVVTEDQVANEDNESELIESPEQLVLTKEIGEREQAIMDMLEGRKYSPVGIPPSYNEIAQTIVIYANDHDHMIKLISAAMKGVEVSKNPKKKFSLFGK